MLLSAKSAKKITKISKEINKFSFQIQKVANLGFDQVVIGFSNGLDENDKMAVIHSLLMSGYKVENEFGDLRISW